MPIGRDIGELGLEQTTTRLRSGIHVKVPLAYLIPLAETLAWIYSLHEWHRKDLGDAIYFPRAEGSSDGKSLLAIVWARGAVAHELIDATHVVVDLMWHPRSSIAQQVDPPLSTADEETSMPFRLHK